MARPVVALLTDFGLSDHYVGAMKGVILGGCPDAALVDITHGVPAQDVVAGALELAAAWRYFPPETVFLAVVDPGVGSGRRRVAVDAGGVHFVGPDNGLLALAVDEAGGGDDQAGMRSRVRAVELSAAVRLHTSDARTFDGRDWFAPAAARLARGAPLAALGTPVERIAPLDLPRARLSADAVDGEVLRVDRFGNLITNIDRPAVDRLGGTSVRVEVGSHVIEGLVAAYWEAQPGALCALYGSTGYLEIAQALGSAAGMLQAGRGTTVRVARDA